MWLLGVACLPRVTLSPFPIDPIHYKRHVTDVNIHVTISARITICYITHVNLSKCSFGKCVISTATNCIGIVTLIHVEQNGYNDGEMTFRISMIYLKRYMYLKCVIVITMFWYLWMITKQKNLNVITLNVRGLPSSYKHRKLFIWFQKQSADVIFIQETHCTKNKINAFKNSWTGHSFYALTNLAYSRGSGILLNPRLNATIMDTQSSDDGHKLLLNVEIENRMYTLINIYAPNSECERQSICRANTLD